MIKRDLHFAAIANNIGETQIEKQIETNSTTFRVFIGCKVVTNGEKNKTIRRYTVYRAMEEERLAGIDMIPTKYGILVDGKRLLAGL